MDLISLAFGVFYTVVIVGICGFLLARGFTHAFLLWFAGGALLEAVPQIGYFGLQQAPGGFSAHMTWVPVLFAVGRAGAICSLVGFVLLAAFLLRTRPAAT
jgi:hypothetical protein